MSLVNHYFLKFIFLIIISMHLYFFKNNLYIYFLYLQIEYLGYQILIRDTYNRYCNSMSFNYISISILQRV